MSSNVTADYTSPTSQPFTLSIPIPASADQTTQLAATRDALTALQESINRELTARMDEDKARAAATASGVDEAKEEENYGEEVIEEED